MIFDFRSEGKHRKSISLPQIITRKINAEMQWPIQITEYLSPTVKFYVF
jgi:hypothetical protein